MLVPIVRVADLLKEGGVRAAIKLSVLGKIFIYLAPGEDVDRELPKKLVDLFATRNVTVGPFRVGCPSGVCEQELSEIGGEDIYLEAAQSAMQSWLHRGVKTCVIGLGDADATDPRVARLSEGLAGDRLALFGPWESLVKLKSNPGKGRKLSMLIVDNTETLTELLRLGGPHKGGNNGGGEEGSTVSSADKGAEGAKSVAVHDLTSTAASVSDAVRIVKEKSGSLAWEVAALAFNEHIEKSPHVPAVVSKILKYSSRTPVFARAHIAPPPEDDTRGAKRPKPVSVGKLLPGSVDLGEAFVRNCIRTDRDDGLYTTVVVDELGRALGLVYSSRLSIRIAMHCSRGVYYSRSRRSIWRKGATSGSWQEVRAIAKDCDEDALLFRVRQHGYPPSFCHLGTYTCWGCAMPGGLKHLEQVLWNRKEEAPKGSYTKRLFDDPQLLYDKLLEEAQELAEAEGKDHVASEAADVIYFALVAAARGGARLEDIEQQLDLRSRRIRRRPGNSKPERIAAAAQFFAKKAPSSSTAAAAAAAASATAVANGRAGHRDVSVEESISGGATTMAKGDLSEATLGALEDVDVEVDALSFSAMQRKVNGGVVLSSQGEGADPIDTKSPFGQTKKRMTINQSVLDSMNRR